jgi:hypothetical protein
MKKNLIIATTIALGLASVGSVGFAQDQTETQTQTQTTTMQNVVVTQALAEYEVYYADLHLGYGLKALVGHTHRQYVQARRVANKSEALRMSGMAQQPFVAVAIDNSSGPGLAKQLRLIAPTGDTVAIVNVYCKRVMPSGGKRCLLDPLPVRGNTYNQSLASTQVGRLQLTEANLAD